VLPDVNVLLAFAITTSVELVTFDKALAAVPDLRTRILGE
jgi:predicted nucleic acid-binding protein